MRYLKLTREDRQALVARLAAMPAFLEASFDTLSPGEAATPGPDGTPSPVEQCWHLADLEREGYAVRIRRLLDEADPLLPDFDGDRIARERRYTTRNLGEALAAFRDARAANLAALRAVHEPDWFRAGVQEGVGAVALCDIPAMMDQHDEAHRREIEEWKRESR